MKSIATSCFPQEKKNKVRHNIALGCGASTAAKSASTNSFGGWDHWAHKLQPYESSDGKIEENAAVPIGVLFFEAEPGA